MVLIRGGRVKTFLVCVTTQFAARSTRREWLIGSRVDLSTERSGLKGNPGLAVVQLAGASENT